MSQPAPWRLLVDTWEQEFRHPDGHCSLCGGTGIIDTRGQVFTQGGVECGKVSLCICPHGRQLKRKRKLAG